MATTERLSALVLWAIVAAVGAVVLTQMTGSSGFRLLATVQTLTPYLVVLLGPIAVVAARRRWHALAATASLAGIGLLALAIPIVFPPLQSPPAPESQGVRVAAVNLLYSNDRTDEVADVLVAFDADVIVFTEFTPEHRDVLGAHELAERYPSRVDRAAPFAEGIAVWSRHPVVPAGGATGPSSTITPSIDAEIAAPDGSIRLLAVHPPTPVYDFDGWRRDLDAIRRAATDPSDLPTLVIGDFNASYWHPPFRALLAAGFTDAHIALDRGWSMSWPTDVVVPPYVRLDHALTGRGLVATDVDDFRVPGSDHSGFVVTVAPAR